MKPTPRQLRTADAVIAAVGVGRLVRLTGRKHSHIGNWRRDGQLAHRFYLVVLAELEQLGYWAKPELWGIVSPKKPAKRRA